MYGKFFASTFTGSMFGAGADIFAVWGYVIANTVDSTVELNPGLIAAAIGSPRPQVEEAIQRLCAPDPQSRNPAEDGRRLIHENGFQYRVTSHEIYRAMRNEEERREYNRDAQRRSRANKAKKAAQPQQSNDVSMTQTVLSAESAHTEAEAETREPPRARARDLWAAWQWYQRYKAAWQVAHGKIAYGDGDDDAKATGELEDKLNSIPGEDRLKAQDEAQALFARYFELQASGHPWKWFVQRFNELRAGPAAPREQRAGSRTAGNVEVLRNFKPAKGVFE